MNVEARYMNVAETFPLYDTVLISKMFGQTRHPELIQPGWFENYNTLSGVGEIPFFNVRSRNVGLAYNNQDARDSMPYPFEAYSLGVAWFGNALSLDDCAARADTEEVCQHIFQSDIPRHSSISFKVNQDERFRAPCLIASPGYGPVGGGAAHGALNDLKYAGAYTVSGAAPVDFYPAGYPVDPSRMNVVTTQGVPLRGVRWPFPVPIEIPKRASISAVVTISDYGRQLLAAMSGPGGIISSAFPDTTASGTPRSGYAGIQVTLYGKRLVQQRGEYHA